MDERRVPARLPAALSDLNEIFGGSADLNTVKFEVSGIRCAVATLETPRRRTSICSSATAGRFRPKSTLS